MSTNVHHETPVDVTFNCFKQDGWGRDRGYLLAGDADDPAGTLVLVERVRDPEQSGLVVQEVGAPGTVLVEIDRRTRRDESGRLLLTMQERHLLSEWKRVLAKIESIRRYGASRQFSLDGQVLGSSREEDRQEFLLHAGNLKTTARYLIEDIDYMLTMV